MKENRKKDSSIVRGVLTYSISTWFNFIFGFLSVIISTRLIDPTTYGYTTMFVSAATVLMYVLSVGMDGAFIRFYNEPPNGNTTSQLLYKNIIVSSIVVAIVGTISVFFFSNNISQYVFGTNDVLLVKWLFVYAYSQVVLRLLNISFRMGFRSAAYNVQNILISSLTRILIIVGAFFFEDYVNIILVLTIGTTTLMLAYLVIQRNEIIPRSESGRVNLSIGLSGFGEYFRFAMFSAPTYIVTYVNIFVEQQVVRSVLNSYYLGIFSSTGIFASLLGAIKGGFSTFWSAYVFKNYKEEKTRISAMHEYMVLAVTIIASSMVVFRDVLYLFIGESYHESKEFYSILLIAPVLSILLETTSNGIAIAKKNEILLTTHIISALTNIFLCYVLTPLYGLKGAAFANAIAGAVLFFTNSIAAQKYYRNVNKPIKSLLSVALVLGLLIFPAYSGSYIVNVFATVTIDAIIIWAYKKETGELILVAKNMLLKLGNKNMTKEHV